MDYKCPDCGNYMEEATICLACFEKAEKRIGQLESAINEALNTNGYQRMKQILKDVMEE